MSTINTQFSKGQRIRFSREPLSQNFEQHYTYALEYIDRGKVYTVEHFFNGVPSQVELKGIDSILFLSDMFEALED